MDSRVNHSGNISIKLRMIATITNQIVLICLSMVRVQELRTGFPVNGEFSDACSCVHAYRHFSPDSAKKNRRDPSLQEIDRED